MTGSFGKWTEQIGKIVGLLVFLCLALVQAMRADTTYGTGVYRKQEGDELVVAADGAINVESGGEIQADGTQAAAIADVDTAGSATAAANATAINSILAALRGVGVIASS